MMLVYDSLPNLYGKMTVYSRLCGRTDSHAFSETDTLMFILSLPAVFCAERICMVIEADRKGEKADEPEMILFSESEENLPESEEDSTEPTRDSIESEKNLPEAGKDSTELTRNSVKTAELTSAITDTEQRFILPLWKLKRFGGFCFFYFRFMTVYGKAETEHSQLLIYAADFRTPEPFYGGIIYQIFPDRFSRGGLPYSIAQNYKIEPDWNAIPPYAKEIGGEIANDVFYGGNLYGIAGKLDRLKMLGVNILYLCPIFESASNHRYDTGDYAKVDSLLGGDDGLIHLISEAKRRGIRVILDGVFAHTGADSRYFNRYGHYQSVGAYQSTDSPYYEWYTFYHYPDRYAAWWNIPILPKINTTCPSWRRFICGSGGIAERYEKIGIDGWRLDVADELSNEFLDDFYRAVKRKNRDALIIGEVWENASDKIAYGKRRRYFCGGQMDSVMNYPLREGIIDFIRTADRTKLCETVAQLTTQYPRPVLPVLMNLLGTHDTERILTVFADVGVENMTNDELAVLTLSPEERMKAIRRLKIAWAIVSALPGLPTIYYGDEYGMEGGRDPFNRRGYVGDCPDKAVGTEETGRDEDLFAYYCKIGSIRRSHAVFSDGGCQIFDTADKGQLLFCRYEEGTRTDGLTRFYVAVNLTEVPWHIELPRGGEVSMMNLVGENTVDTENRAVTVTPNSCCYFIIVYNC